MSGGSYNYAYQTVNDFLYKIKNHRPRYRRAFANHLEDVSEAMRAIEWADSGDSEEEEAKEAIMKCLKIENTLEELIHDGKDVLKSLKELLDKAEKIHEK